MSGKSSLIKNYSTVRKKRRKESVIPYISTKIPKDLSEEQLEEILGSFNLIDANSDGRLSKKELTKAAYIMGMNPTDKEIEDWWKEADVDGDGFISLNEYIRIMKVNYESIDLEAERMKTAFATLDRNGDGILSLDEFRMALSYKNSEISMEEVDSFFNEVDKDGDGQISYEEFVESALCMKAFS